MKPTNTSPDHEDTRIGDATSGVVTTVVRQHDLGIGVSGMDESWIKLYRRIESSEIWRMKPDYFKLWVFLLIRAARKPRTTTVNGVPVTLNKGDVLMSVEAIALSCKVSEQTVRSFLKWCNRSNMIVKQKSHGVTHLSICNYSRLQESSATEVKQKSIKSATEVQLSREEEVKKKKDNKEDSGAAHRTRPSNLSEAVEYFATLGMPADEAQRFTDYYTANGWKVGRNPMKDWKAAARNWRKGFTDKQAQSGNTAARTQPTGMPAQVIEIANRPKLSSETVEAFKQAYLSKVSPDE